MSDEQDKVNEPAVTYRTVHQNKITFFNSFEEAEEHGLKQMAAHSYAERLANLEVLRKRTYKHLLLANGEWPPIEKMITIEKRDLK